MTEHPCSLKTEDCAQLSSLALAHVGDAVYDLLVRSYLCEKGKLTAGNLHKATVTLVNAKAQHTAAELVIPKLSGEELSVFKRARNAHSHAAPKNTDPGEYHAATGLEALFGWLWLSGEQARILELFDIIMEAVHGD